jgi:hypothetical protein
MKINGPSSAQPSSAARAGGRAVSGDGFSLSSAEQASQAAEAQRMAGLESVMSVSALLTLQGVEDPMQRKRRAVSRAGRILDVLDELKIALLDGEASSATLERLLKAVREERAGTDDPRLEGLLNEIETRAAVEIAKLGRSHAA